MKKADKDLCAAAVKSAINTDRGLLFFRNLAADLKRQKRMKKTAQTFFELLASELVGPRDSRSLTECLADVCKDSSLNLKGPKNRARFGPLTTTTTFKSLENYYLDLAKSPIPMGLSEEEGAEFLGESNLPNLMKDTQAFRGGKDMVWLAPLSDIKGRFGATIPEPDELRSYLGLSHLNGDDVLVNIEFDTKSITSQTLRKPTAFDGGPNLIFRSDDSTRKHGFTVDLVDLSNGSKELVTDSIPAKYTKRCRIIGQIKSMPAITWKEVADSCTGDISLIFRFLN